MSERIKSYGLKVFIGDLVIKKTVKKTESKRKGKDEYEIDEVDIIDESNLS